MKKILFAFFIFCSAIAMHGASCEKNRCLLPGDTTRTDSLHVKEESPRKIHLSKKENKKLIAAILAFPVPFGFIGLHRIYLGTEPWIPVVYLITAGGGMILPLIDFIAILCADKEELKKYENNNKMFMWID